MRANCTHHRYSLQTYKTQTPQIAMFFPKCGIPIHFTNGLNQITATARDPSPRLHHELFSSTNSWCSPPRGHCGEQVLHALLRRGTSSSRRPAATEVPPAGGNRKKNIPRKTRGGGERGVAEPECYPAGGGDPKKERAGARRRPKDRGKDGT